jgi:heat shock protein HtpX
MTEPPPERVLVWDRVDANRRATKLLLAAFAVVLLPVAAYLAMYLMLWVAMVLGALIVASDLGDVFAASDDDDWMAAFGAVDAAISVLILVLVAYLQFRFGSAIVLRLARARPVSRDEEPQLGRTVENLCIGAGLPQPRLHIVESPAANAFSTGLDRQSSSLVVTRGLLGLLDRRELEGVLAHELAQIGNGDTRLSTVLAAGVALLRLPMAIVVAIFRFFFRIHWVIGWGLLLYLGLPLLATIPFGISVADDFLEEDLLTGIIFLSAMVLPFYIFLVAPLLAHLIRRAVMRQREYLADADAVLLTRHPEALARALVKMSTASNRPVAVSAATAHLYVVDPLPQDAPWWDTLFPSHPPLDRRVALLAGMGGGIPPSVLRAAEEAGARFSSADAATAAAEAPQREAAPPIGADMTSDEVRRTPVGFRLTGAGATLYEKPDAASAPLAQLTGGALITVVETEEDFLRVLTADDSFGYIPRSTPMTQVDLDGWHGES